MNHKLLGVIPLDPPCLICKNEIMIPIPVSTLDMLLMTTNRVTWKMVEDEKLGKTCVVGFQTKDDKFVCHLCWRLLVGLERTLNLTTDFDESAHNPEVQRLVRTMWTDTSLTDKAFTYRGNGGYYPAKFVDMLKRIQEPMRWRKFMIVGEGPEGTTVRCGYPEDLTSYETRPTNNPYHVFFIRSKPGKDAESDVTEWLEEQGYKVEDHRRDRKNGKGGPDFIAHKTSEKIYVEAKSMTDSWRAEQALWAVQHKEQFPYWLVFVY